MKSLRKMNNYNFNSSNKLLKSVTSLKHDIEQCNHNYKTCDKCYLFYLPHHCNYFAKQIEVSLVSYIQQVKC